MRLSLLRAKERRPHAVHNSGQRTLCRDGHPFLYEQDPGGSCLIYAALSLWHLGYPDQALRRIDQALTAARELAHPFSLAFAFFGATLIHIHRREWQAVQERARALLTLATEQDFLFFLARATFLQGWALVEEGLVQMEQGLAALRSTGLGAFLPKFLAWLAEAYMAMRRTDQGLAVLAEAVEIMAKTEEREYEAEVYRLKGELLLAQKGSRLQAAGKRRRKWKRAF